MTEHRIIKTSNPAGNASSTTTIITDDTRSGGASKWFLAAVLVGLAVIALYFFTQASDAEIAKDNAVAEAAEGVGDAAAQIGEAAGEVGAAARDAADSVAE